MRWRNRRKANGLHPQGVSGRKVMIRNSSHPSRHAKDYLGCGCSWTSPGVSGIVENQDMSVAEGGGDEIEMKQLKK
jgi:hypothetical protein